MSTTMMVAALVGGTWALIASMGWALCAMAGRADRGPACGETGASGHDDEALRDLLAEHRSDLGDHAADVARLAYCVARRMGLSHAATREVRLAAELHDIGKLAIARSILDKPGELDASEWSCIREHTLIGEQIVAGFPPLRNVATLVRSTHEHYDGAGYPDGLAREAIPLGARIITACDGFTVIVGYRAYDGPRSEVEALAELRRCAGTQFDPAVIDALCAERAALEAPIGVLGEQPSNV